MEFAVRPFTKDNAADFCRLYQLVYRKKASVKSVIEKFSGPSKTADFLGFLAYDGSLPIAFYGTVPIQMCYGTVVENAAQSVDTMTHPDYRGKGLFTDLAERTYQRMQEEGITFVFGFPNQNSEYGFLNKLGWQFQERLCGYTIRTNSLSIEKIARRIPWFKERYASYVDSQFFKYKTDKFPKKSTADDDVSVYRNSEYLAYKRKCGSFVIVLENCLFWIRIANGLQIGEIEAASEADFMKALDKLLRICRRCGISKITFQVSPSLPANRWMKNLEIDTFDSWIAGYRNFNSAFPLERLKFTLADIDIF